MERGAANARSGRKEREKESKKDERPLRSRTKLQARPFGSLEESFSPPAATSTYRDKDIAGISRYAMTVKLVRARAHRYRRNFPPLILAVRDTAEYPGNERMQIALPRPYQLFLIPV